MRWLLASERLMSAMGGKRRWTFTEVNNDGKYQVVQRTRTGDFALVALIGCFVVSACSATHGGVGHRYLSKAPVAGESGSSGAVVTQLVRTGQTISDQALKLPEGPAEMIATSVDIPAGASLVIHRHPWSRFFYVERGTLRVTNQDTGTSIDVKACEARAEAIGQWHAGRAVGDGSVRVIVIDLVPPGATNTVVKP